MGSGASLQTLSAEQVGDLVCGMGGAYNQYKSSIVDNGCDGKFLFGIKDENEFDVLLEEMKISNKIHVKKIRGLFTEQNLLTSESSTKIKITLTKSPRELIAELSAIQAISLDPQCVVAACEPIKDAVKACISSGTFINKEYDCFISYRVSSETDVAEKLFYNLKLAGFNPFLDKMCLKNGEDWKEGFLSGLQLSKCFISLLSAKALKPAKQSHRNHSNDNYLIEIEHALEHQRLTDNNKFIIPVHVGEYIDIPATGLVLVKFKDYDPQLYSESVFPSVSSLKNDQPQRLLEKSSILVPSSNGEKEQENQLSAEALFEKGLSYHLVDFAKDLPKLVRHYETLTDPILSKNYHGGYSTWGGALGQAPPVENHLKSLTSEKINEAVRYYKMATSKGHVEAIFLLGISYRAERLIKNVDLAIRYYRMAIEKGHVNSMYHLGRCFEHEISVKNVTEAVRYYKMAVEEFNCRDENVLCALASLSKYQLKDDNAFEKYMTMAAENGSWQCRQVLDSHRCK
jgi:hypothetical protein